jgi:putative CocE/NonD family hydrolase
VLRFTTEELTEDTEVTGPVVVNLWAASDAPDTDFVARLVDVYPDETAINLTDGIIRARYRKGTTPELLIPGTPNEFAIDLWATSNLFRKGHRIRVDICSASFPRWDRNPNTGAKFGEDAELRMAQQTIYHDEKHPSRVVLPIVPRTGGNPIQ